MNKQRGFSTSSILLVILLGVALVGGGAYYTLHQNTPLQNPPRDYLTTQIPVQPPTTPVQQKPTSAQTNITIIATVNHFTFELPKGWTSNGSGINPIKLTDQSGSVVATVACPQRPLNWENRNTTSSQTRDFSGYRAVYHEMTAVDAPANSVGGVQLVDIYIAPVGWDPYSNNPANECILSSTDNGKILSSSTISGMKEIFTTWAVATDL